MIRSCMFCTAHRNYSGDKIKKDETGGACSTYGVGDSTQALCWVNLKQAAQKIWAETEDNIKMDLKRIIWEGVGWIQLARDRDKWRDIVNAVMSLGVP